LEAAGIPVLLKYESAGLVFGITVDGLGKVEIMVPEALAEEAEYLLQEQDEAEIVDDEELSGEFLDGDTSLA
jgi:hypothetical protein